MSDGPAENARDSLIISSLFYISLSNPSITNPFPLPPTPPSRRRCHFDYYCQVYKTAYIMVPVQLTTDKIPYTFI
jgi:hypothetical protein